MNKILSWLPIAVTILGIGGLVIVSIQQNYRSSLNDPQMQIAEDAATALRNGKVLADVVPRGNMIEVTQSLSPFIAVFDKDGNALESNGTVGGLPPKPPKGVFDYAQSNGEHRVTWQPEKGLRIALVIVPVNDKTGYFAVSGRNMREGERRVFGTYMLSFVAIGFTLLVSLMFSLIQP